MSTTKKPRLSFDIPADVGSGRDAGWVYRSDAAAAPATATIEEEPETSNGAVPSLSLALRAMVQMATLTMAVATIPLTIGMRVLGVLADTASARRRQ
jgi:hypothetical protein